MKRDDPIAHLRALDPAAEKDVDHLVAALAGDLDRMLAQTPQRGPRRSSRALPVALAVAAVVVLTVLVTNPFGGSGAIRAAEAKAQVARALEINGAWHIARVTQTAHVKGSAAPRFKTGYTEEVWHAPDGRLLIRGTNGGRRTDTTLYARGERRTYDSGTHTLRVHRFVLAADMRDDERRFLPATAADLYRAAYRLGKVRLAGIETLNGRRVYRLAFDWRDSSYTLVFDASRRVPIYSDSRAREPGDQAFIVRVRYTAYQRIKAGAALDRRLALPAIPGDARIVQEHVTVIPTPAQGATASRAARGLTAVQVFPRSVAVERATYVIVRRLGDRSVLAVVGAPSRDSRTRRCFAFVEIAHPGGEATADGSVCAGGGMSGRTRSGTTMFVGAATKARTVELRFAGGKTLRAQVQRGFYLATFPAALSERPFSVVSTTSDGSVTTRPWPQFPAELTSAVAAG